MTDVPVLETEHLLMREPRGSDFETYREFFADAEASKFYNGPLSADGAWRVLASDIGHWQLRGFGRWALVEKSTSIMIGSCGLWWPGGYPRSELTWWIIPQGRRRGYALEASRQAIRFGYEDLGWSLVETHTDDANLPARGLVAKLGGTRIAREVFPDGVERDVFGFPKPKI